MRVLITLVSLIQRAPGLHSRCGFLTEARSWAVNFLGYQLLAKWINAFTDVEEWVSKSPSRSSKAQTLHLSMLRGQ